jgi:tetratricopeptide (TPR) repeat protein
MSPSLQDILRRRQQEEFVGREEQLAFFQANLGYAPEDPRRRFVVNVYGQGGVGKTWLLRRFRQIVEQAGAVVAYTDEAEDSVPGVMGRIAQQFDEQGHPLKAFAERYKVYRRRKEEIEADPEAPQGFPAFLGRTLARGGLSLARRVPVGGVVADFVDEDAFASLAGDFATYVARKISNKDEVHLVLEPVEVLTPLFLADLRGAEEYLQALFFDTYERTDGFLDPWLRDLLEGRHGDVPANVVLVIAGRDELDRNLWSSFEGVLAHLSLEPFTEVEARDYLIRKGIHNEQVVKVILHLSGRLPLLVATLAAEGPDVPAEVGDPSGEAVERFLKWVEDPEQRRVALDAALPRFLNRDVLAVLAGSEEADALFAWLKRMPFVEKRGEAWAYHNVVRTQMLRYKHRESPQGWANLHGRLAQYYGSLRDDLGLDEKTKLKNETWQGFELESLYHRLCQAPQVRLTAALNGFLAALDTQHSFAHRWAEVIRDAGEDTELPSVRQQGWQLAEGINAYFEGRYQQTSEMFTTLLQQVGIEARWQVVAFGWRGVALTRMGRYEDALADLDRAIELDSNLTWAVVYRGITHRSMRRYQEALADFRLALELGLNEGWILANRGVTYRLMERYEEALSDFDRAIELRPDMVWPVASRGQAYRDMGRYEDALADFDRVIELDPNSTAATLHRGIAYMRMGHLEKALADFNRAIKLDPNLTSGAVVYRGIAYRDMGRCEDALADFRTGLELGLDEGWILANRGVTYRLMERYEEALSDFDRAIELRPDMVWPVASRGQAYRDMGRYEDALVDFGRVIELDPNLTWVRTDRGITYRKMGRYTEALADLDLAVKLAPHEYSCLYHRALTHQLLGQVDKAHIDLSIAIQRAQAAQEKAPRNWRNTLNLALYHLPVGEAEEAERLYREVLSGSASYYHIQRALRGLEDLLCIFPNHPQTCMMRDLLQQYLKEAER